MGFISRSKLISLVDGARHFRIELKMKLLRPALFVTRSAPGNVVAIAACIERLKIPGVRPNIGLRAIWLRCAPRRRPSLM